MIDAVDPFLEEVETLMKNKAPDYY